MRYLTAVVPISCWLVAASTGTQAAVTSYAFTQIDVPGSTPGTTAVQPNYGMNNLGQIVGGYQDSAGNGHGFIYAGGKYVTFDVPGAVSTTLNGINNSGQLVGTYCCSNSGAVTFLYDHGQFTNIASSNDFYPNGINDKGQILGIDFATLVHEVYTRGVFDTISVPDAIIPFLDFGFNNRGQVVGTYLDSAFAGHAFLDTNGVFTPIVAPGAGPGGGTIAWGVNDQGQIVGNFFDSEGNGHGFIDTSGQFATIDAPNASAGSTNPELITDNGQIFGFYFDAAGNTDIFLGTPIHGMSAIAASAMAAADPVGDAVPEASTWTLILMGFGGLAYAGYRARKGKLLLR